MKVGFVPAEAGLGCDGSVNGIDDGFGDLEHLRYVSKESCAGPFAGYFLHGAAKIDVDEVGFGLFDDDRRVPHGFRFASVDLYSDRSFFIMDGQFACSGGDVPYERVGVDELRIDAVGSVALAEHAEGGVCDVLHRGEI